MKIEKRAKKVIQLLFFFALITLLSPFILAKLIFMAPLMRQPPSPQTQRFPLLP